MARADPSRQSLLHARWRRGGAKAALVLLAGLTAALSLRDAAAATLAHQHPRLVLALAPAHVPALEAMAQRAARAAAGGGAVDAAGGQVPAAQATGWPSRHHLALRQALGHDPLSPRALRLLALHSDPEGQSVQALRLLRLAHRLSRRDGVTQTLLAASALRDNRPDIAMTHVDAALATGGEGAAPLHAALAQSLGYAPVRAALAPYMGRDWAAPFLGAALDHAEPALVAQLLLASPPLRVEERHEWLRRDIVQALAGAGRWAQAAEFALALDGSAGVGRAHFGFDGAALDPRWAPLTWHLGAELAASARDGRLEAVLPPMAGGLLASRVLPLAPGSYRIAARILHDGGEGGASLRWRVRCRAASGVAPRPVLDASFAPEAGEQSWSAAFVIEPGCGGAEVLIDARNLDLARDSRLAIADLALVQGAPAVGVRP